MHGVRGFFVNPIYPITREDSKTDRIRSGTTTSVKIRAKLATRMFKPNSIEVEMPDKMAIKPKYYYFENMQAITLRRE